MLHRTIKPLGDGDDRIVVSIFSSSKTLTKIICKKDQPCVHCKVGRIGGMPGRVVICGWCIDYIPEDYIPDLDTMGIPENEFVHMFEGKIIKRKARKLVKEIKEEI